MLTQVLIAFLVLVNTAAFAVVGYDCHKAYYNQKRLPRWLPITLACIGGIYGFLFGWLLFRRPGRQPDTSTDTPTVPWGSKDQPYLPPDNNPLPDDFVPGWGDTPINGPDLPAPGDNLPTPPNPDDIINLPPEEGGHRIAGSEIIAILDTDNAVPDMERFVKRFQQLYPQKNLYKVNYYNTTTRMIRLLVPISERVRVMQRLEKELKGESFGFFLTDNYALNESMTPSTPGFAIPDVRQYFDAIQAPLAWDITQGSSDVTVAIVDSFFALDHPDLDGRWRDPINITTHRRNVLPPAGAADSDSNHGTHVAGIAIGSNTGRGASGMAPRCRWIPIALGKPIWSINMLEGVLYAIYKGADVVNVSLGLAISPEVLRMPVDSQFARASVTGQRLKAVWDYVTHLARERKCVIVWAAGNDNSLIAMEAMKRNDENIKVSAVDGYCRKAPFSNHGNYAKYGAEYSTLSAPGVGILSCVGNSSYDRWDGTSMAAPIVTGAVALMKSLDRSLTPKEVVTILVETGRKTPPEEHIGPVIQVRDALLRVRDSLVHFDDVVRDNKALLGSWEATKHLLMTDKDDEYLDDVLLFFNFKSMTDGELTMRSVNQGDVYTAQLSLSFVNGQLNIIQIEEARCRRSGVAPIQKYTFECKADSNGLLLCVVKDKDSGNQLFSFHLRKIKTFSSP